MEPERIPVLALWSAPRCRSTAFARMMAERGDRVVVHEPFSQVVDFGEVKVGDQVAHTERDVLTSLRAMAAERPVFFKDTTDFHYPELLTDQSFLAAATHTFIIRHPAEAIASHYELNPNLGRDEIGFAWLHEIFAAVRAATAVPAATGGQPGRAAPAPDDQDRPHAARVGAPGRGRRGQLAHPGGGGDPGWLPQARHGGRGSGAAGGRPDRGLARRLAS